VLCSHSTEIKTAYQSGVVGRQHPTWYADQFANRIIKFNEDGTVIDFEGNYEEFVEKHKKH
jgi:ATPase subunit of ABC transporter with duplicated ATPase domains